MRSLTTAATGMMAQQLNVDVIAHNIANVTTTGFKRSRTEFADLLYQDLRRVGTQSSDTATIVPAGVRVGVGVKPIAIYRITEQGSLIPTNNPLDVAIKGRGYFQVTLPDGTTAYTRDGALRLSNDGTIVTADGFALIPNIVVPDNATGISINANGQVEVTIPGQIAPTLLGQLQLATFINEAGMEQSGDNLLLETEASGGPVVGNPGAIGFGTLQQNFLEQSNVNMVSEMTDLITAQRAYEINSKVIQASDDMMQTTTNIR
ncbi:flagellar basal-body rod protein FlgG [Dongia mobilis]|uniref:Flagellar basal-body rod protein FlgG n=1 Tax=Dongia mobilis TaxID=578943 RepID=A0A4R6WY69_9PROT|nr:flagellar basal-body rod protein FlgG [Dongia mobilis]TDQ84383.1 flagellar basal-body rod protein FlgG [Dongia mobilis]